MSDFKKHTHPTDAVFFYEDPYFHKNIYFNVDFKSYSDTSITLTKLEMPLIQWLEQFNVHEIVQMVDSIYGQGTI